VRLTVLNVAYPLAPFGPDAVGGAEQVMAAVEAAVTRAGHRSIALGCEGSRATGELRVLARPPGPITPALCELASRRTRRAIEEIAARERIDVVHLHGVDFSACLPVAPVPVLATLHLPVSFYAPGALAPTRPRTFLHCVSRAQRRMVPPGPALLDDIPNGVDLQRLRPAARRDDYALVLSRICPEKGIHLAIEAARLADRPLLIAGAVFPYPEHERYFATEVVPRLDGRRRFLGPVGLAQKAHLLAHARCVIIPSLLPETSSLVAMEALAAGAPVVAYPQGAIPELIEPGITGHLVNTVDEMARVLRDPGPLSSSACRTAARARFSARAMCERYLAVYEQLATSAADRARGTPEAA
jgi:glycosyltransferase involved in cell wall biosynthesis